ncbi:hypothetical protein GCM10027605_52590 [Micromonospora zhanjiangensis]
MPALQDDRDELLRLADLRADPGGGVPASSTALRTGVSPSMVSCGEPPCGTAAVARAASPTVLPSAPSRP